MMTSSCGFIFNLKPAEINWWEIYGGKLKVSITPPPEDDKSTVISSGF
jgi:hypothetical protein